MTFKINIKKSSPLPLYCQIKEQIRKMIESEQLEMDFPIPPEMELAENNNISRTVVRHALSDLTKEGYLRRIAGKGTFVSKVPEKMKNNIGDLIALVMPFPKYETMFTDIIIGCEHSASEREFDLVFFNARDNDTIENLYIKRLKQKVKGFIFFLPDNPARWAASKKMLEELSLENIPFVLIDRYIPGMDYDFIGTDNASGAYDATMHLIKQDYEKIACVISDDWKHRSALKERLAGYKKAIDNCGLEPMVINAKREKLSIPKLRNFIKQKGRIGVFATEYWGAMKALEIMTKENFKIPDNAGIIGFDEPNGPTSIPISTVLQPMQEIGKLAAQLLIDKIRGNDKKIQQIQLKPELIKRESSVVDVATKN